MSCLIAIAWIVVDSADVNNLELFIQNKNVGRVRGTESSYGSLALVVEVREIIPMLPRILHHLVERISGRNVGRVRVDRDQWKSFRSIFLIECHDPLVICLRHRACIAIEGYYKSLRRRVISKRNHFTVHILQLEVCSSIANFKLKNVDGKMVS